MTQNYIASPVCLQHDHLMQASADGYSCAQPGCDYHYTFGDGYFELVDGNKVLKGTRRCPECHVVHMYLAERSGTNVGNVWICPNKKCPSKEENPK